VGPVPNFSVHAGISCALVFAQVPLGIAQDLWSLVPHGCRPGATTFAGKLQQGCASRRPVAKVSTFICEIIGAYLVYKKWDIMVVS